MYEYVIDARQRTFINTCILKPCVEMVHFNVTMCNLQQRYTDQALTQYKNAPFYRL